MSYIYIYITHVMYAMQTHVLHVMYVTHVMCACLFVSMHPCNSVCMYACMHASNAMQCTAV